MPGSARYARRSIGPGSRITGSVRDSPGNSFCDNNVYRWAVVSLGALGTCSPGRRRRSVVVCTAMTAPPTDGPLGELGSLLDATITRVQQVTGAQSSWDTPRADSPAGVELAAEEARRPAPKEGSWPWLLAPMIASWALQVAVEEAKGFSAVLAPETTSYAADVLCRGVLETTSLAWWLLDPEIDSETRLARSLVYRLNSADQTERAIKALELEPEENRAEYGELPEDVKEAIASVGLIWERRTHEEPRGLFCGEERLPTYTERAASLVAKIWPQRRLPYAVLSAVTHGELLGLQRNLVYSRSG